MKDQISPKSMRIRPEYRYVSKLLNRDLCAKCRVDIGNELGVCLFRLKTGNQPGHESRLAGKIIQCHDVQRLGCSHISAQFRFPSVLMK